MYALTPEFESAEVAKSLYLAQHIFVGHIRQGETVGTSEHPFQSCWAPPSHYHRLEPIRCQCLLLHLFTFIEWGVPVLHQTIIGLTYLVLF